MWEDEIEPLLRNDPTGKLKATTIIDWLAEQHPGRFSASQLGPCNADAQGTMHTHRGTAMLELKGSVLEGDYYTGRDRREIGTIELRRE